MLIKLENAPQNLLKHNEEACALREIFNIIEAKLENTEVKNNNHLLEQYKIKNIKLEINSGLGVNPKNRFKSKLKKILFKK